MDVEDDLGSAEFGKQPGKHQEVRHVMDVDDVVSSPEMQETHEAERPRKEDAVFECMAGYSCLPLPHVKKAHARELAAFTIFGRRLVKDGEDVDLVTLLCERTSSALDARIDRIQGIG